MAGRLMKLKAPDAIYLQVAEEEGANGPPTERSSETTGENQGT